MNGINNSALVTKQYASAGNLNTRISIHDKYSTNKMGFGNWIFSNYEFEDGAKVLELGCGTGNMWIGKDELIGKCSKLVISDFSDAMVETAKGNIGERENIEYRVVDIQDIPFEDGEFDVVIANMMLYHVPDLAKGLAEVRRVLKDGGKLYCATYGEHGIMEYLSGVLSEYGFEDNTNKNFTLQNGEEKLLSTFTEVKRLEYKDSLEVTDVNDMVEYIYSMAGMTTLVNVPRQTIHDALERKMVDGVLSVPKEYGMFVAW